MKPSDIAGDVLILLVGVAMVIAGACWPARAETPKRCVVACFPTEPLRCVYEELPACALTCDGLPKGSICYPVMKNLGPLDPRPAPHEWDTAPFRPPS